MKQTYIIIKLIDANGALVTFERWSYKRVSTCMEKMRELYTGTWANLYQKEVAKADHMEVYDNDGVLYGKYTLDILRA